MFLNSIPIDFVIKVKLTDVSWQFANFVFIATSVDCDKKSFAMSFFLRYLTHICYIYIYIFTYI